MYKKVGVTKLVYSLTYSVDMIFTHEINKKKEQVLPKEVTKQEPNLDVIM